jgi:dihydrofolate synthase/folylpolyglutamate synthase
MSRKNLSDWLAWQESLNPAEIELGLDRIRSVAGRLELEPPQHRVVTVAGTNGKGSCAAAIEALLRPSGLRVGLYTSPHLVRYNERVRIDGDMAADNMLVRAFERIESARGDIPLTFFEYGTLAALLVFTEQNCNVWVLEVGLGGRLDAVNIVDPDVAVITTIALDHESWLGDTVEEIAAEKAGVMRAGRPVFFGDSPVPKSIREHARAVGAELSTLGSGYSYSMDADGWVWRGERTELSGLPLPSGASDVQVRNQAVALAAMEALSPALLSEAGQIAEALRSVWLPGRCQEYDDGHRWLLDVAHNPQAAMVLRSTLTALEPQPTLIIVGMLADKQAEQFGAELADCAQQWIACPTDSQRGSSADDLAARLRETVAAPIQVAQSVAGAMALARQQLPAGGRIVVCGSFLVVGPALEQLGLY